MTKEVAEAGGGAWPRPGRVRQKLSRFSEESPDAAGSYAVGSPGQSPGFPTSMRSGSSNQISRVPAQINK